MDLLSDILTHLKLKGTLYFRTSFTSPWSVRVPSYKNVARFHFAHKGRCMVRIGKHADPVLLEQGDMIIITQGAEHNMFCELENENPITELDTVLQESQFPGHGTLVYGEFGTNHETQLVCGHFAFEDDATHPIIEALPDHIMIRNYGENSGNWLENTLRIIGAEGGRDNLGSDIIALKMSEIIFTQALRQYLETEGKNNPALAGYTDPRIVKALKAIHDAPSENWSLEELASVAGMSRTSFSTTFSQHMSMSPIAYVTQWRMELSRQRLLQTNEPLVLVAEQAGYQSEAAFSRVFKKTYDMAPASYRREHRGDAGHNRSERSLYSSV